MEKTIMGFENASINISKEIIGWARTGENSFATRLVNINTNKLRYGSALKQDVVEISKKPLPKYNNQFVLSYKQSGGGLCSTPELLPPNYVTRTKSGQYVYAPHYKLDKLWAKEKGDGTYGVHSVVLRSLENDETCGRVILDASCIDKKTSPGAFYYKLGFRFNNPILNEKCEQWIKAGGKYQDAPSCTGYMYLPKENIEHCLKYGNEKYYYETLQPAYKDLIEMAMA